ncbi:L-lysine 6-monooxygenase [Streptomyces yokosukanensis]|uniref:L-lysine N6-monooxygenase MbtG n=1 Tax=Streptomyces yokosukanensis TaxID=67386 RepID=A0A101NW67_9ACTN|nr:SidA/IucD/PvdA family monooxygenase [Streptomyces yokosukanensis]KUN00456.1 L-lysine 6-monooxygenase [Streptomyces yokosukanensis]
MARNATERKDPHYTCVGIGVGPANLSLASLLHGHRGVRNIFFEKKAEFGWHEGQQIPGTSLQVSLFKDLVTLAEPTNPFSFLAYLHDQGKIYHFLNAQFDALPRQEFRNYMRWASERNPNIAFGEEVRSVGFDTEFVVRTNRRTVRADNLAVGVGTRPWLPPQASASARTQFHVNDFVRRDGALGGKRVCVVGGGQSGAEAVLDLLSRTGTQMPRRVTWVSRRANFFPIDDSPFTNDFYMPCHSEHFFRQERSVREAFNHDMVLSSDGISESTLREIYQRLYVLRFVQEATDRFALYPNRSVEAVAGADARGWELSLAHHDQPDQQELVDADVVVWATGFRPADMSFLHPLAGRLEHEGEELRVDDGYAVRWDGPAERKIFVQNATRGQRGLADPNLSLNAYRSQRIADRLRGTRSDEQRPSFIEWSAKTPAEASWAA